MEQLQRSAEATWQGPASCLSSRSVVGVSASAGSLRARAKRAPAGPMVLVDEWISPTDVVELDQRAVAAVILRAGSLADHTAGLLNARGIQLAVAADLPSIEDGTPIYIDGARQILTLGADLPSLEARLAAEPPPFPSLSPAASDKPRFRGEAVRVFVDGKSPEELSDGIEKGASGVGILRTEWIGWLEDEPPTASMHHETYRRALRAVSPRQLQVRLFDIGGDKVPGWARQVAEQMQSPLGYRGIRAARLLPEAFGAQLEALGELSGEARLGVVLPMVTDVADVAFVQDWLANRFGQAAARRIRLGAMVEVPSAALSIAEILEHVDFIRIGPGDLTQFTLAKLRKDFTPSDLSGEAVHPSVVRLIRSVAEACREADTELSICLDVEPRPSLLATLLEAGVRRFCVSPSNVPITRFRLREACEVSR